MSRLEALACVALCVSCATQKRVLKRPAPVDLKGVALMPFAGSAAEGFTGPEGHPCGAAGRHVEEYLIGWQTRGDDPACSHDTLSEGMGPAVLEMRWVIEIPEDGAYEVVSTGYSIGGQGQIVARGSYYGDYWAKADLVLQAHSAHCGGVWVSPYGKQAVTGWWARSVSFSGWTEIPPIGLQGCRAHDELKLTLRFVGQTNRGSIEINWFGFSVVSADEIDRVFGLRRKLPSAERAAER